MKKLTIFILLFIIVNIGMYGQAMLGNNRSDVLITVNSLDNHFHQIDEGMTKSGRPYISAVNREDDLFEWMFDEGKVMEYVIIIDSDDLNGYIEQLNKKYVREKTYQWSDYSDGERIYWWITAGEKFYHIRASYSNPE